jgi:hypothetical protein
MEDSCPGGFIAILCHAPVATEVYRQLLRQDFHLLEHAALARRTTESGKSVVDSPREAPPDPCRSWDVGGDRRISRAQRGLRIG